VKAGGRTGKRVFRNGENRRILKIREKEEGQRGGHGVGLKIIWDGSDGPSPDREEKGELNPGTPSTGSLHTDQNQAPANQRHRKRKALDVR